MKVLAFLQNMWVRDPAKVRRMIDRDTTGLLRERLIEYALFAGCFTGKRLKSALGEGWCNRIVWEEASPVITGNSKECPPPDPEHIRAVIQKHSPDLIVCLSKPAYKVIREITPLPVLDAPHPAYRGVGVSDALARLRVHLDIAETEFNEKKETAQPSAI